MTNAIPGEEPDADWHEANYRHLLASLDVIRLHIARSPLGSNRASACDDETDAEAELARAVARVNEAEADAQRRSRGRPALTAMADLFGLSRFERDALLLAAGPSLSPTFGTALASIGRRPSFELAFLTLPSPHWQAAASSGALREFALLELERADEPLQSPLHVDERVLFFLLGLVSVDARLDGVLFPMSDGADDLSPAHVAHAETIAAAWSNDRRLPLVQLCGADAESREAIAGLGCLRAGLRPWGLRASDLNASPVRRHLLARLVDREAILSGSALVVAVDHDDAEEVRAARTLIARLRAPVVVSADGPLPKTGRPQIRIDVAHLGPDQQRALWRARLGAIDDDRALDFVVGHFRFGPTAIRAAATELTATAGQDPRATSDRLREVCRRYGRSRLPDLAQHIESRVGWSDLVLPDAQKNLLRQIAADVANRTVVHEQWQFSARGSRGLGLSALFYGESGTGKTLAAEVIANEVGLDLWRVDVSRVLDKYIGETEKNLSRVFDAAEDSGAILLFDEADALFSKRSEVRDNVDRFANVEVAYLLQRMEAYSGLAILTTNLHRSIDPAFKRRIRIFVEFPFPSLSQRALIWQRAFPAAAPTARLDVTRLAQLNVSGGNIRNIALTAAFLAAGEQSEIRMRHILQASRTEYAKLEKMVGDAETAGWGDLS